MVVTLSHTPANGAERPRRHPAGDRRGAPAVLRRHHPGPPHAGHLVGGDPQARRPRQPPAQPVPRPAAAGRPRVPPDGPHRSRAQGRQVPHLQAAPGAGAERKRGRCDDCPATYDEELYEKLRAWRTEQASEAKVPAYVVFTDATLQAIAETKPADPTPSPPCRASGPAKLERYAEQVLALVNAWFSRRRTRACSPRGSPGSARWRRAGSARRRRRPTPGASAGTRAGC